MGVSFRAHWDEDSGATCIARLTASDGSGVATGVDGEGNWLQVADFTSIVCEVFDLDGGAPTTPIATPTVTVSSAVLDTPVLTNELWTEDSTGYNFLFFLGPANFPTGGNRHKVLFTATLTSGNVFHFDFTGPTSPK